MIKSLVKAEKKEMKAKIIKKKLRQTLNQIKKMCRLRSKAEQLFTTVTSDNVEKNL